MQSLRKHWRQEAHSLKEGDTGFAGELQKPCVIAFAQPYNEWIFVYYGTPEQHSVIKYSMHFSDFSFEEKSKVAFQE